MSGKKFKKNRYRPRGENLITSNRIKPENWCISAVEAKATLRATGLDVKEIKKITLLKHKICISYWDEKGGVCSGFFSYRIFSTWQKEVEVLIENCPNFKRWQLLNRIMRREFMCFSYPKDVEETLNYALKNRLYVLKTTARQTVADDVGMSSEWEFFESLKVNS